MFCFVSILWRILQFNLFHIISISLWYVGNISPSAGVLISHETWETIIVRRRCYLAQCFAEPDTTFLIKLVERVSCSISFHAATYNIVTNKSTRPLFLHTYLKFRYLCNATRRHDDYRDYIRKMGTAFGNTYRVSHFNRSTQISPKLYFVRKNISNETYFGSRWIYRDGRKPYLRNFKMAVK